jgi:hypothetical protein
VLCWVCDFASVELDTIAKGRGDGAFGRTNFMETARDRGRRWSASSLDIRVERRSCCTSRVERDKILDGPTGRELCLQKQDWSLLINVVFQ